MPNPKTTYFRLLVVTLFFAAPTIAVAATPMVLDPATLRTPTTYPAKDITADGVTGVYLEALPWKGKPTRAFAWYGMPAVVKAGDSVPGMVLVHGGGGTAFAEWVKLWNGRGYAAIAVDTCGQIPKGTYGKWARHEFSGPAGWGGLTAEDVDQPAEDQWTYHAVSDVALAFSLLRSLPNVDAERIGITGISWGGYLTCISAAVDSRYKLAVPVYGCGFLGDNSAWLSDFKKMGDEHAKRWLDLWDPSRYLPAVKIPTLWVTGTNDFAYPMDSLQKSYRLVKGPWALCVTIRMPHGHGPVSEQPPEIHAFADAILKTGRPLVKITEQSADANTARATFDAGTVKLDHAVLNYTIDTGPWDRREWKSTPATIDPAGSRVTAELPDGVTVFYLNLVDDCGLTVSTEHQERASQ